MHHLQDERTVTAPSGNERPLAFHLLPVLDPVEGDLLPSLGSIVEIHLNSLDAWVPHLVVGYYVWPAIGASGVRVNVQVVDRKGYPNARALADVRRPAVVTDELRAQFAHLQAPPVHDPAQAGRLLYEALRRDDEMSFPDEWRSIGPDWQRRYQAIATTFSQIAPGQRAWPKAQRVGRIEDMSPDGRLEVMVDGDGDAIVAVSSGHGDDFRTASVEFCTGFGGGRSPRTRKALLDLMLSIEADNEEVALKQWPPARA